MSDLKEFFVSVQYAGEDRWWNILRNSNGALFFSNCESEHEAKLIRDALNRAHEAGLTTCGDELAALCAEVERSRGYYQTALGAWNNEIKLRKQAEAKLAEREEELKAAREAMSVGGPRIFAALRTVADEVKAAFDLYCLSSALSILSGAIPAPPVKPAPEPEKPEEAKHESA